jgi:hypothetical protein
MSVIMKARYHQGKMCIFNLHKITIASTVEADWTSLLVVGLQTFGFIRFFATIVAIIAATVGLIKRGIH